MVSNLGSYRIQPFLGYDKSLYKDALVVHMLRSVYQKRDMRIFGQFKINHSLSLLPTFKQENRHRRVRMASSMLEEETKASPPSQAIKVPRQKRLKVNRACYTCRVKKIKVFGTPISRCPPFSS